MVGIYKITSPNGKVYIGQAYNIHKRWIKYKRADCKNQPRLYASLKKHDVDKHKFEVVTECSKEELNDLERYYQEIYSCLGKKGLNCQLQKTGTALKVFSEETRYKMRVAQLGKKQAPETLLKKSIYMTGKVRTKESIAKFVETRKRNGKRRTKESIMRQSNIMKERHAKTCSETIKKHIASLTKDELSERARNAARKVVVLNTETGIFYKSITEAADSINMPIYNLSKRLKGRFNNKTSFIYA